MWRKAGTPAPKLCRECRKIDRDGRPRGRTVPVEVQRERMVEGRLRLRRLTCACGTIFEGTATRRYCESCREGRRRDHYRRKGAIRRSARWGIIGSVTGQRVTITELGQRDRWTCGRCGEFVNRNLAYPDPWMPSFGHIKSISLGGLDSEDNLRLEHLVCNVKAGAS